MKKFLIVTVLLSIAVAFYGIVFVPAYAEKQVVTFFKDAGFNDITIGKTNKSLFEVTLKNIKLDKDGFNTIDDLTINPNIFLQHIDSITISKITYTDVIENMNLQKARNWITLNRIRSMPVKQLSVEHAEFNLGTNFGDIRVEAKTLIKEKEDGAKSVQAVIWARQYQLAFEIPVSGIIKPEQDYIFESAYNDGKLNIGPLRVSRLNGWASAKSENDNETIFATQLDAGSARIFNIPLNSLFFTYSQSPHSVSSVLRTQVSGLTSSKLAGDYNFSEDKESGSVFFELQNTDDVKKFLKILNNDTEQSYTRLGKKPLLLSATYQPDRSFASGPIPFEIELSTYDLSETLLKGNVVLYPETLEIKGRLLGQNDAITDVKKLFPDMNQSEKGVIIIEIQAQDMIKRFLQQDDQG